MELLFLALLFVVMIIALGSKYLLFRTTGAAIITIIAGAAGAYLMAIAVPILSAMALGVAYSWRTNFRGIY